MDGTYAACHNTWNVRQLTRDENDPTPLDTSTDTFGMAFNAVPSVELSGAGSATLTISTAYMGDVWVPDICFAANHLVYRPALDGQPVNPRDPPTLTPHGQVRTLIFDAVRILDALKQG